MDLEPSFFERTVSRPRHPWLGWAVILLLILAPFAVAYTVEGLDYLLQEGRWRGLLIPPLVIAYIMGVAQWMERVGADVVISLRPLVQLGDKNFQHLLREAGRIRPRDEGIAFRAGAVFGLLTSGRVITSARDQELEAVRESLQRAFRELRDRLDQGLALGDLPGGISSLEIYHRHLLGVRTWPYNTAMLRTLFFSVLIPGVTVLARIVWR